MLEHLSPDFRFRKIAPYGIPYSASLPNGYIVWRKGTGDNYELLHIRTYVKGKGTGRELLRLMLLSLRKNPPYATVFGFTRVSNESKGWYEAMGFDMTVVKGVYAEGSAIVFSQTYDKLMERHCNE